MRTSLLLVAAFGAACGASSAEIKKAREASYQTEYQKVWDTVLAEVSSKYEIYGQDPKRGVIYTKWKKVERTAERTDTGQSVQGAYFFAAKITLKASANGGPPITAYVDGIASEYRPGMAVLSTFKHGVADEPTWVQGRIDSLYVGIHEQLQGTAVYGSAPPAPPEAAFDLTGEVDIAAGPATMGAAGPPPVDVSRL